jgi:uncharacterized protein (TIGR03067 family)
MKRTTAYLLFLGISTIPVMSAPALKPTKDDLVKADLANLKGTWKIIFYQKDGIEESAEQLAKRSLLTFDGTDYRFGDGATGKIASIDPTTSPKAIDYRAGSDIDGADERAIYSIDGDKFMDCIAFGNNERPREFVSRKGSGHVLIKYMRVKKKKVE